nr:unnamed protein product [Timema shepardi]
MESMIMNLWALFPTNTTQTPIKNSDVNHHNKETYMTTIILPKKPEEYQTDIFVHFPKHKRVELVRKSGYPCEEHLVVTEDGYILTVHRIPIGRVPSNQINLRPPVLLVHGILSTSDCWMLTPPDKTLRGTSAPAAEEEIGGLDVYVMSLTASMPKESRLMYSTNIQVLQTRCSSQAD